MPTDKTPIPTLSLSLLPGRFAVCRMAPGAPIPSEIIEAPFASVTCTGEEVSLVVPEERAPEEASCEKGWCCLKVEGPLDFALTGVLASLCNPLAAADIPLFALSTYNTDYLLVKEADMKAVRIVLTQAGHRIEG